MDSHTQRQNYGNSIGAAQGYADPAQVPTRITQVSTQFEAVFTQIEQLEDQASMLFRRLEPLTGCCDNAQPKASGTSAIQQLVPLAERLAAVQYRLSQLNQSLDTVLSRLEV